MKNKIVIIVMAMLSIGTVSSQGFGSESPWENVDQGAENMDKGSMKQVIEGKKANNRGGQGGSGGFAAFNTNTKDVPIDNGILIAAAGLFLMALMQIKRKQQLKTKSI